MNRRSRIPSMSPVHFSVLTRFKNASSSSRGGISLSGVAAADGISLLATVLVGRGVVQAHNKSMRVNRIGFNELVFIKMLFMVPTFLHGQIYKTPLPV